MSVYRSIKGDTTLLEVFELFVAPFMAQYKNTHSQATDSEAFSAFWGEGNRKILWAKVLQDMRMPGERLHYHNLAGVKERRTVTKEDDLLIRMDRRAPGYIDVTLIPEGLDEEHSYRLDSRAYTHFLSNIRIIS